MKKLLIIYMLIVGIVLISGCTSDEKQTDLMTQTDANLKSDSQTTNPNNELNTLESFIDPKLKNFKIEKSDPDIEVVRAELLDSRDYAESGKWVTNLLLSNNGNQAVYIGGSMKTTTGPWQQPYNFKILNAGERMWFNMSTSGNLNEVSAFVITSSKTVTPYISPEFKNLEFASFHKLKLLAPFIDLHSIKYEITDDSHGWESLVIEVSNNDKYDGVAIVEFYGSNNRLLFSDGKGLSTSIIILTGKTEIIKIPLRTFAADDIYSFKMSSTVPQEYQLKKYKELKGI